MSRGNDTTVTRRGLSVMCTSIVTSLRSPGESSFAQRGKSATSCPSHESVPAMRMSTPPSIAPSDGGIDLVLVEHDGVVGERAARRPTRVNAATPVALTHDDAARPPRAWRERSTSGCRDRSCSVARERASGPRARAARAPASAVGPLTLPSEQVCSAADWPVIDVGQLDGLPRSGGVVSPGVGVAVGVGGLGRRRRARP